MVDDRDQRVRLAVVTAVATAAGVGILSSLWLRHRRRVTASGFSSSGSAAGYSTDVGSVPDRADSTQPVNSRWDASSRRSIGVTPTPEVAEGAPSAGGEQPPVSLTAQAQTGNQDSSAAHTWVAFESTGQLVAAAAAATPPGSDGNASELGERSEDGGDAISGGQPQKMVLPPEDTAARAQARSNLASIYSTVGAALPLKQRPQMGVPQRGASGMLAMPEQPLSSADGAQPGTAPVDGAAGSSSDAVASASLADGPSGRALGDDASAQRSAAMAPHGAVVEDTGATLPLWQRLLALTAAGVEADDERDDERDNNDTDAGPHGANISSEYIAGSAARPERQAEQQTDATPMQEVRGTSAAGLPPMFPRPKEPAHVEDGPNAARLVRLISAIDLAHVSCFLKAGVPPHRARSHSEDEMSRFPQGCRVFCHICRAPPQAAAYLLREQFR